MDHAGQRASDVVEMDLVFGSLDAGDDVSRRLPAVFAAAWPAYQAWFLRDGEHARASYRDSRRALQLHMPQILPTYDALVEAVGGGDLEARFLSHWCPPPLFAACSLAAWTGNANTLVRNYDYPPVLCDTTVMRSSWRDTHVLAMSDCVLGALDGLNADGLAVAIAFGGRKVLGPGFGIGLVVRYVLEVARDVHEALDLLARVPVAMAYNVALVDTAGGFAIAHVAPDRPLRLAPGRTAGNRQGRTEWPEHASFCATVERERVLDELVKEPSLTPQRLLDAFLRPPLYRSTAQSTWPTVYTAAYDVDARQVTLAWPERRWELSLARFTESSLAWRAEVAVPPAAEAVVPAPPRERPLLIA